MTNHESQSTPNATLTNKRASNPIGELQFRRQQARGLRQALLNFREQFSAEDTFIARQIAALDVALDRTDLPDYYRVAVVGSFKVGKSSFINKVCEVRNLASVSTNPETATITSFRYDTHTRAEIHFLSQDIWEEMAELHARDPSDPQARRYQRFSQKVESQLRRDEEAREAGKQVPERDYEGLLRTYVNRECRPVVIECADWEDRKQQKAFAAQIKSFVSSSDPLHCLVERVEIFAPLPLIQEGIELIDTPGLDDTDVYRVQATEREVNDVDAIIFLTHSGRSYSQSDKEFLVTQVRKRRLRSLKLAITKIDVTYDAAVRQAEEEDEDPPTFDEHKREELERVRNALTETLDEILLKSDLTAEESNYFTQMLRDVEIFFISSVWYDQGQEVTEKIANRKRSGIPELQGVLGKMFQNADIVRDARREIDQVLQLTVNQVESYAAQQRALQRDIDHEKKVEGELLETQKLVTVRLKTFARKIDLRIENARMLDTMDQDWVNSRIRQISTYVQDIIDDFEKQDLLKHWKVRREGGWLYLDRFARQVANRTFAAFDSVIKRYQEPMLKAALASERHVDAFIEQLEELSNEHELFRHDTIELVESIRGQLRVDQDVLREIVETEQQRISEEIENFMDEEMEQRIGESRFAVSLASGRGTTDVQNAQVQKFYDDFSMIVRPGFEAYLQKQFQHYLDIVAERLGSVYQRLNEEIEIRLDEQRAMVAAIRANQGLDSAREMTEAINVLEHSLRAVMAQPLVAVLEGQSPEQGDRPRRIRV